MMSKTEQEYRASVVYRIWRSVQKKLQRESDMPNDYRKLKPCWKRPFQAVARLKIPAVVDAWKTRAEKIRAMHTSAYKDVGLTAQIAIGRSRGS